MYRILSDPKHCHLKEKLNIGIGIRIGELIVYGKNTKYSSFLTDYHGRQTIAVLKLHWSIPRIGWLGSHIPVRR